MNHLKIIALQDFPLIEPGDDLSKIILNSINNNNINIDDNDVLVIAQKIVSKSENRYVDLEKVKISEEAKKLSLELKKDERLVQLIMNESNKIISTNKNVIIVEHKLGLININAGIDLSNISQTKNQALLLPENPSKSAKKIQENLSKVLNKNISLIITDSMTRPYRYGVINFALASYNIQSLIDLKGEKDLYENKLKGTEVAVSDELASAAGLLMGQGSEGLPVILIKGFDKKKYTINDACDLIVNERDDLYRLPIKYKQS